MTKTMLAKSLGVSRQSLYYKPKRPDQDAHLRDEILQIMDDHPGYGHRRVTDHFHLFVERRIGKNHVLRVMQKYHIKPKIRRGRYRWPRKINDFNVTETPNHIRHICPTQPNVIWVGDFTELTFHGRKVYLATVMDAYTREIIAWQIALHHTTRLVIDTLEEAHRKRDCCPKYFHSDQGSEYTAHECLRWLVKHGITPSMSPKGKPWNNGKQESFYLTFKSECGTPQRLPTIEALIEVIGKYINYYNTRRIHSALKRPPRRFYEERKWRS
jgi:putative transposase